MQTRGSGILSAGRFCFGANGMLHLKQDSNFVVALEWYSEFIHCEKRNAYFATVQIACILSAVTQHMPDFIFDHCLV